MSQLIDIIPNILTENTICFDIHDSNVKQIHIPIEDVKFGIINFKAITSDEINNELDLVFSVDASASMSDICSDNRSKMQHIIHTLKNMIMFFNKHPNINVNITIDSFDDKIYEIVPRTKVTEESMTEIISKIEKIFPNGSTNIELALKNASEKISELNYLHPNNIISHIFMTDGESTAGSNNIQKLQKIIDIETSHSFIGFGIDHDGSLLNGLGSIGKNGYYFIDKLEYAGLVYGEILHGIIYKLLDDVEIEIENGLIYDFKTNTWVHNLAIGSIVSEANKTFNIISSNPDQCKTTIKGTLDDLMLTLPSTKIEDSDLTTHIYRQRSLQLLYEVNEFCNKKRDLDNNTNSLFNNNVTIDEINNMRKEKKDLKLKLTNLLGEIKKYMEDNNLQDDKTLKNLCDDIYISYRTFGTKVGTMFCTARLTSQGAQRQYTASNTQPLDYPAMDSQTMDEFENMSTLSRFPTLIRHNNFVRFNDSDNDDLPILHHEVSSYEDTPYLTPQANNIMRGLSRSINEEDDEILSVSTQCI